MLGRLVIDAGGRTFDPGRSPLGGMALALTISSTQPVPSGCDAYTRHDRRTAAPGLV
jgi:hypothetical protein